MPMSAILLPLALAAACGGPGSNGGPSPTPSASATASATASPAEGAKLIQMPCQYTGGNPTRSYGSPPPVSIDETRKYKVTMDTPRGQLVLEVDPTIAPITANNFIFLACNGFYNGLKFHRVENWVVQGGDPRGDGTGGPGYQFNDEPVHGSYVAGVLAMANAGPNTNGSQFFILKIDYPLPPSYNIFGKVLSGMDAVNAMQVGDTMNNLKVEFE
jgi:cyclophilin family peptidyl-prolyl cis-trans isomerase